MNFSIVVALSLVAFATGIEFPSGNYMYSQQYPFYGSLSKGADYYNKDLTVSKRYTSEKYPFQQKYPFSQMFGSGYYPYSQDLIGQYGSEYPQYQYGYPSYGSGYPFSNMKSIYGSRYSNSPYYGSSYGKDFPVSY